MVYIKVLCPHCDSDNVVRYGQTTAGAQRFRCQNKECTHKIFQLRYTYNACKPGVRQQIIEMAQNGSGTRDTGRVLNISKDTVTAVLKKNRAIPRAN